MFLVDSLRRTLNSVPAKHARAAFVPDPQHRSVGWARNFLCSFQHNGAFFQSAVRDELARAGWPASEFSSRGSELVETAARAIAERRIDIAFLLHAKPILTFAGETPFGTTFEAVGFPDRRTATAFLASLAGDGEVSNALQRSLAHEAGQHWVGRMAPSPSKPPPFPPGATGLPIADASWNPEDVAGLLADGLLMLLPVGTDRSRFRLCWRRRLSGGGGVGAAAPAAGAPSTPPTGSRPSPATQANPETTGPRSVLPVALATISPQADVLIAAAKQGQPFCEECAKLAAERAREAALA